MTRSALQLPAFAVVAALVLTPLVSGNRASLTMAGGLQPESTDAPAQRSKTSRLKSFKGVSFSYDTALAEAEAELVPACLDGKPGDIVPEHLVFFLTDPKRSEISRGWIQVFPIANYRKVMISYTEQQAKVSWPPTDWVPYLDDQIRTLKALIKSRPVGAKLEVVLNTNRVGVNKGQMPFLPMYDAHQAFHGKANYWTFQNGMGVSFLTQRDTETSLITKEYLLYVFQGIADNGRYYVSAEFPVSTPFLPSEFEPEVIKWSTKNYLLPHASKSYQAYLRPVIQKLEAMPANKFEPSLTFIEHLIQSLKIEAELPGRL